MCVIQSVYVVCKIFFLLFVVLIESSCTIEILYSPNTVLIHKRTKVEVGLIKGQESGVK